MNTFEAGESVWAAIGSLSENSSRKKAAVSYVTSDAILKFATDDLLVLDASDEAVRAGSTSAHVIQRALYRGASVVSIDNLHAKVMLFDSTTVVGSANISVRSAKTLMEAVVVSTDQAITDSASEWINGLAESGEQIDDSILQRLLEIENERPPIKRTYRDLAETHIVFFKQVMPGDIEKYLTRSSTSGTGGGARDLRVSQFSVFGPLLSQMLSERSGDARFTQGRVLSQIDGDTQITEVQLWRPTAARANELRLSRFYEVPGWEVSEETYGNSQRDGIVLFYVLEMDVHGTVTAKVLSDSQLTQRNATIRSHVNNLRTQAREGVAIVGAVDVITNVTVP